MNKLFHVALFSALVVTLTGCTSSSPSTGPYAELLTSGPYAFSMDVSTANLSGSNCPTQAAGFVSSGPATVTAGPTPDDQVILNVDGQTITFTTLGDNEYNTGPSTFTSQDSNGNPVTGTTYFELTVLDSETASGRLMWDNAQGCKGDYPFSLEYTGA